MHAVALARRSLLLETEPNGFDCGSGCYIGKVRFSWSQPARPRRERTVNCFIDAP
jgi:hypothetical protein